MNTLQRLLIAGLMAAGGTVQAASLDMPAGTYTLDPTHAYITFGYSHLGFSTPQVGFENFDVTLELDPQNVEKSKLSVTIDAESVSSRVAEFDKHLRDEKFFAVDDYPEITFVSTGITSTGESTADVEGVLTIRDVSKPVVLKAVLNKAAMHPMLKKPTLGITATANLKRSDWGLDYAVPMVSDEVELYVSVELPKAD